MNTSNAYVLPVPHDEASAAQARNPAGAFAAALRQGDWDEARRWLDTAASLEGPPSAAWSLRKSDWFLAQQRWDEAQSHLQGALDQASPDLEFQLVVRHKLASIAFMRRDYAACVAWLSPALETVGVATALPRDFRAVEIMWVRALHNQRAMERLHRWVRSLDAQGHLDPAVAGVASLSSWETGDSVSMTRWLGIARALEDAKPPECYVVDVFLAMSSPGSRATAVPLAESGCARWPADGRVWAAAGLARLSLGDAREAESILAGATASAPDYVPGWCGLGWAQIVLGKVEAAQGSFLSALFHDDGHIESRRGLAVSLTLQGHKAQDEEATAATVRARLAAGLVLGLDSSEGTRDVGLDALELSKLLITSTRKMSAIN